MRLYIRDGSRHYVEFGDWFEPGITPLVRVNYLYETLVQERDRNNTLGIQLNAARREAEAAHAGDRRLRNEAEALREQLNVVCHQRDEFCAEACRLKRARWWHSLVTAILGREPG